MFFLNVFAKRILKRLHNIVPELATGNVTASASSLFSKCLLCLCCMNCVRYVLRCDTNEIKILRCM